MINKFIVILLLFCTLFSCQEDKQHFDLLLMNGQVLDGIASEPYQASIGINKDTIAWIGTPHKGLSADKIIDANGYFVSPGFIDPHTHTLRDLQSENRRNNLNYLTQGVTTVVNGSDGRGPINVKEVLQKLDSTGIGTNAALLVGHSTARRLVMGMDNREPTAEELKNMKALIQKGMREGALGLSSGLFYAPASFSKTEEVIALAEEAAKFGGLYDVHMRDESTYNIGLVAAVEETIEIARKAKIKANIAHIKALGVDVWGYSTTVINTIKAAREEGLQVTADQYPWEASSTGLGAALVPKWVFADTRDFTKKFDDPSLLPKIKEEMAENLRRRGGAKSILLIVATDTIYNGKTLEELARGAQKEPIDMAIEILKKGGSAIASFNMKEEDIQQFIKMPWVMTSSDGSSAHPRKFASFPKKIRKYVKEEQLISLTEMVKRSSSLTSSVFGIPRRGQIHPGYFADIIIFKLEEVLDKATYQEPDVLSEGMSWVIVNGEIVIAEGVYNGKLAGRAVFRE